MAGTCVFSAAWRLYNSKPGDCRLPGSGSCMHGDVPFPVAATAPGFLRFEPRTYAYDGAYTHIFHFTGGAE